MTRPDAAIQWKNSEVCIDLWCDCGTDLHHDGSTSGQVQCPVCGTVWVLGLTIRPRSAMDFQHDPTIPTSDGDS